MARFNPHHQIEPVLEAAAQWRDRCLIANGSLFYPDRAVWTPSNIASLNDAFIDHPDTGEDTFLIKLRGQVAHLAPDIVRLTAEMIWVLQLFPSNTGAAKKRDNIENILSWLSDPAVPDRQLLADEVLGGVGSTGTAFNTHRPKEFAYLISMSKTLKSQNEGQRQAVLSDPWAFAEFLKSVPVEGNRQLSHIVEYLLFPDTFERISSGEEKRKIIVAFGDESADAVKQLDREGRDRRLVAIRRKIAAERGDPNFDFYDDEFRKLWQEGEGVEPGIGTTITSEDVRLFQRSRRHSKYAQLMPEEVAAYRRIHSALGRLGQEVVSALSGGGYVYKLTSGYTPQSGVRGALPKDLWFGVHAAENADAFVGHPQLFMIVSERGIEYGFSALTHPADFSNAEVKARVRGAAPNLFRLLPSADSALASSLSSELDRSRGWKFLRKERLSPDDPGFENLGEWLTFLHSMTDFHGAAGNISRFLVGSEIDDVDLLTEVRGMARIFDPLMQATRVGNELPVQLARPTQLAGQTNFASITARALTLFRDARTRPYTTVPELWQSMDALASWFGETWAVNSRPHIFAKWSLGRGNWASVPWLALMNRNVTTSTQYGLYVVLLVSEDLSTIYLTLNQGMTKLVAEHGEQKAVQILKDRADRYRQQINILEGYGYTLDNEIDLKTQNWRASNYQPSTIAYMEFDTTKLPGDDMLGAWLEPLLEAYDTLVQFDNENAEPIIPEVQEPESEGAPYLIEDALEKVFLEKDQFERILSIWRTKKNLLLQGAPGVGKSFVARHLAYALMGRRDDLRVESIQFHQAYSYEDFIQGFKPNEAGGFELKDGVFHRFCRRAAVDLSRPYVFIIDEINRGNLSKIFGELMLLIEADKRSAEWGTHLAYARDGDPRFHVPENVFIIGMMNTADRSLSMVDYALRRRFSFITLEPAFSSNKFREFLKTRSVPSSVIDRICSGMDSLNRAIGEDNLNLGPGYRIGHSFFVPSSPVTAPEDWYHQIIESEISPLLDEYWFDAPDKARTWTAKLLNAE